MQTRAKFQCQSNESGSITLSPVVGGSDENDAFFNAMPFGSIQLGIVNAPAAAMFVPGHEYYVDFTEIGAPAGAAHSATVHQPDDGTQDDAALAEAADGADAAPSVETEPVAGETTYTPETPPAGAADETAPQS